ncbi:integral membrane protein [Brucella melitensis bv. 1 str. Rev.1]|nr:Camphor resistance protein CrcB1 [Brucella melitensis ATCC 23457]ADZ68037.1 camphor resistance protein CrcB [Brucella melitensis M28]ADZ88903.1 camphor resistance protein CrcB [Brucella melitensis M5-90]AEQ10477.1 Camphor resistance protein CrcB1 [Brucella melitensis NI]EEW87619.1 camphor resistance CrcB protein [Brucella melitensis bv. 1 str. 16M]EEZ13474.1 integral membrane protein [Brucella melitensis bv. 1 str. Rev.1]EPZ76338.1 camphor resistance protein CrcB [Brucella melitensis ADMAS
MARMRNWRQAENIRLYIAVGCGAAIGALLRFLSGWVIVAILGANPLWGTSFVNIVGSFIIMFFATLTGPEGRWLVSPALRQFVMGGLCGGLTTFSSMSLDTFLLVLHGNAAFALAYLCGLVFLSLSAAMLGLIAAQRINR